MKKLIIGLLLVAQVSGVRAKIDFGNHPDIYRDSGPASFDHAFQKEMAAIKIEGKVYQAELAEYNAYVKNAEAQNKISTVKRAIPFPILSKAEWISYGKPRGNQY